MLKKKKKSDFTVISQKEKIKIATIVCPFLREGKCLFISHPMLNHSQKSFHPCSLPSQ